MPFLQDIIHKVEVAGGVRYIRYALGALLAAAILIAFNLRVAKNLGTQEAMDVAQLARNISEGKGYTTSFVRPFSLYLVSERNQAKALAGDKEIGSDLARIKTSHPDIANPPVYPLLLAGAMKVLPFKYDVATSKSFWSTTGRFSRYQPDFMIQWFNQFLFLVLIGLVYFWARRMFDSAVAMTSAILLFGSEVLWRFSSVGLSTMLLLLIFMGIVWCLTIFSSELVEPKRGPMTPLVLTVATGLLLGLGFLTRYGFGWLIIPTVLFFLLSLKGPSRVLLTLFLLVTFLAVTIPWMIRNYGVCGAPFGTAGYSLIQGAGLFPENRLDRSLHPEIQYSIRAIWLKLLIYSRLILQNEFFTFAGGWTGALFLVGLLVGFRNLVLRRIRYFSVGSLALLFLVQALGRTQLSEDSPGINTENYLVLLLPIVIVYGVGMFFMLMDQIALPARQLRYAVLAVLVALSCSPFAFALLPPKGSPLAYPPYYPPKIIETAEAFRQSDLLMSDIPWAVAWYGNRQCVWLTLNATHNPKDPTENENFFAINDMLKPINGVYLTPKTMDMHYQSDLIRAGAYSWGNLLLNTMLRGEVPAPFPLREVAPDYLPEQMFLTDWKRWNK